MIRTLAYQVSSSHVRAGKAIAAAIENFPGVCSSPLSTQFRKLLVGPLSSVPDPNTTLVLILDGLDECESAKKRAMLLEILADHSIDLPSTIRVLITSRSEHDISCAFEFRQHVLTHELDTRSNTNVSDVSCYLNYRMMRVRSKIRGLSIGADWPSEHDILRLTERASGLFVWASTASEFIDGYDPRRRMDIVLRGDAGSGAENALDVLYRTALESAGNWSDESFIADFTAVVGIVLFARRPLSSSAIDLLLSSPGGRPCMYTISYLGCVLQKNPTVRLLHPSFADFLTTKSRCGRDIWFFDKVPHHRSLAIQCLLRLNKTLRRNLCNLTLSAYPKGETVAEDVAYACIFWVDHACKITGETSSIMRCLRTFIDQHLLHWFEVMSILRRSRETIQLLKNILAWIMVSHSLSVFELF